MVAAFLLSSVVGVATVQASATAPAALRPGLQTVEGIIVDDDGPNVVLMLGTGRYVRVDASRAIASHRAVTLVERRRVVVQGVVGNDAIVYALTILSEHPDH